MGELYKLKIFFTQIKIKVINKELNLLIIIKQVVYARLFLLGKIL